MREGQKSQRSSSHCPMWHSQAMSFHPLHSDHFNVCNDQKSIPTILLSHFAYSYNWISGYDTRHKNLLIFFKFQIEQLKLRFKNYFAVSLFLESRFIGLDNKPLNRTSE